MESQGSGSLPSLLMLINDIIISLIISLAGKHNLAYHICVLAFLITIKIHAPSLGRRHLKYNTRILLF